MEKKKKYPRENIRKAIEDINSKIYSIRAAAKVYNIPKTTLIDTMNNRYENPGKVGGPTVLTNEEENLIVKWIIDVGELGFPVTKSQLLDSVTKLMQELNRENRFKNGIPGKKWYNGFLARHPEISKRIPQSLSSCRAGVTEQNIRNWFKTVREYFIKNDLLEILEDPKRIFNCDESGFYLSPQEKQVLVRKGSKKVYNRTSNDEKECLTVLLTVSADGDQPPPLVLYPYKRYIPSAIISQMPKKWGLGYSESGWMTSQNFFEYVTNVFYPWLQANNVPLPVILFLDGHSSHINLNISEFCKEKGIILTAFYPNATHRLQPLDVGIFYPIKNSWRIIVRNWRMDNNGRKLQRAEFAKLFEKALTETLSLETIKNAFKACGIFPFDEAAIDYSKLVKQVNASNVADDDRNTASTSELMSIKKITDSELQHEIEIRLNRNLLEKFQAANSVTDLEEKYEALYDFWKSLMPENNKSHDYTLEKNLPDDILNQSTLDNISLDEDFWFQNTDVIDATVQSDGSLLLVPPNSQSSASPQKTPIKQHITQTKLASTPTPLKPKLTLFADKSNQEILPDQNNLLTSNPKEKPLVLDSSSSESSIRQNNITLKPLLSYPKENETFNEDQQTTNILPPISPHKTPLKQISSNNTEAESKYPTPFKKALYWPENTSKRKIDETSSLNKRPKIYPTVAISDEFMEHQRRTAEQKEQKENEKNERMRKRKEKLLNKKRQNDKVLPLKKRNIKKNNQCENEASKESKKLRKSKEKEIKESYSKGEFVIIKYEDQYFPGVVLEQTNDGLKVKAMAVSGNHWKWPQKEDILVYPLSDIISKIQTPVQVNNRGAYHVPEFEMLNM